MTTTTRRALTAASLLWITVTVYAAVQWLSDPARGAVLFLLVFPLVWLVWAFCNWSAHQHANRYARDVEKVHGTSGRPAPLPHQARAR